MCGRASMRACARSQSHSRGQVAVLCARVREHNSEPANRRSWMQLTCNQCSRESTVDAEHVRTAVVRWTASLQNTKLLLAMNMSLNPDANSNRGGFGPRQVFGQINENSIAALLGSNTNDMNECNRTSTQNSFTGFQFGQLSLPPLLSNGCKENQPQILPKLAPLLPSGDKENQRPPHQSTSNLPALQPYNVPTLQPTANQPLPSLPFSPFGNVQFRYQLRRPVDPWKYTEVSPASL